MLPGCEATLMGNYDEMKQANKLLKITFPMDRIRGEYIPKNPRISPVSNPMIPLGCLDQKNPTGGVGILRKIQQNARDLGKKVKLPV